MNFKRFINISIVIYVITFFIMFVEFVAIPLLAPYGLPQIFPQLITYPLWLIIKVGLLIICATLTTIYFIFYILWIIVKTIVPTIFGIRKRVLRITPFPQLTSAGIFKLFDDIFGVIFNRLSLTNRFKRFGIILFDFFIKNRQIVADALKPGVDRMVVAISPPKNTTVDQVSNNKRPPKPDYLNDTEKRTVDELYQQCLEEKMIPISKNMSSLQKQSVNIQNSTSKTICKAKMLQDNINLLSFKM